MKEYQRLRKSLHQAAQSDDERTRAEQAAQMALTLRDLCGEASKSRQAVYRIGKALIAHPIPSVLIPVCLDYAKLNGKAPPLALRHLEHFEKCKEVAGNMTALLLMPDLESEDESLRSATKLGKDEFAALIKASGVELQKAAGTHICVANMSCLIPDLAKRENAAREWIRNEPSFGIRIQNDTWHRDALYARTMPGSSREERIERTIRTAAQYVALGHCAAEMRHLVMNHTTTNLAWYGKTEAGVLHNPVELLGA